MIIKCTFCEKKFEVDGNLIPEKGRILQCGSCDQKWFFKKKNEEKIVEKTLKLSEITAEKKSEITINEELDFPKNKTSDQIKDKKDVKRLSLNLSKIFNYLVVLVFTAVALIIFLDTFKSSLNSFFPNLELFLYNLIESIKDIKLFINDLIR